MSILDNLKASRGNLEKAIYNHDWIEVEIALIGLDNTITLLEKGYSLSDDLKGILKNNFTDPESCPPSGSIGGVKK